MIANDVLANDRVEGGGGMSECTNKGSGGLVTIPSPSCSAGSNCVCKRLRWWRSNGRRYGGNHCEGWYGVVQRPIKCNRLTSGTADVRD